MLLKFLCVNISFDGLIQIQIEMVTWDSLISDHHLYRAESMTMCCGITLNQKQLNENYRTVVYTCEKALLWIQKKC